MKRRNRPGEAAPSRFHGSVARRDVSHGDRHCQPYGFCSERVGLSNFRANSNSALHGRPRIEGPVDFTRRGRKRNDACTRTKYNQRGGGSGRRALLFSAVNCIRVSVHGTRRDLVTHERRSYARVRSFFADTRGVRRVFRPSPARALCYCARSEFSFGYAVDVVRVPGFNDDGRNADGIASRRGGWEVHRTIRSSAGLE